MAKEKFYGYYIIDSKEGGVLNSWDLCKKKVEGLKSRYKSFSSYEEAKSWIDGGAVYEENTKRREELQKKRLKNEKDREKLKEAIYFDAGTGRGIGVEARVTNLRGDSYIYDYFPKRVNEFGNINLGKDKTNNYGELVALYCALEVAEKEKVYEIYGDSNLILFFWSQGKCNKESLPEKTVELIEVVTKKRKEFEKKGGKIDYVSGDINPADLGFHKI
ncbi:MAG: viroplasmin family protein [Fusobacteriaceae bacterium]